MKIEPAVIIDVNELEDALFQKYKRDIDVREALWPWGTPNDCYMTYHRDPEPDSDAELIMDFVESLDIPIGTEVLFDVMW
ncbi:MAG: hypothetical protein K2O54_03055 [Prevotella sp.]|nr:hypothetical protein [Prevotella sp.]